MPAAGTILVRLVGIIGNVFWLLLYTIYTFFMRFYNCTVSDNADDDCIPRNTRPVKKTSITPNLCMREVLDTDISPKSCSPRPLVLFFPWMTASSKLVNTYADLYHQRGWDVLTVQGRVKHFLWPPRAIAVVQEVLTYLKHNEAQCKRPLIIHATSIGVFMYTVLIMELQKKPKTLEKLSSFIKAQVFDSIVNGSFESIGTSIAKSWVSSKIVQYLIRASVKVYLTMTRRYTTEFYNLTIDTFSSNPINKPTLMFYSHNDPMCDAKELENMVVRWKSNGNCQIITKSWLSSPHAKHLRSNPVEYAETFDTFLNTFVP